MYKQIHMVYKDTYLYEFTATSDYTQIIFSTNNAIPKVIKHIPVLILITIAIHYYIFTKPLFNILFVFNFRFAAQLFFQFSV